MGTKDSVKTSRPMYKATSKAMKRLKQMEGNKPKRKGWRDKFVKSEDSVSEEKGK